ncbi:hypothetical protein F2Q70_00011046 [Brassica cretica]|uniref:Uncharacterized protein n=1 Tax=Brassica cretica TaxID=69181 RepID=A0A8S9J8Z4_BRACR|nr:hypothetical protein F2Q68_00004153 [Brassica cretica]KAF2614523.1 hypothetical protein F2Q70_00011046 [Brassica cretica]
MIIEDNQVCNANWSHDQTDMMHSVHTSMMQDKPHGQDKLERAETSSVGSGTRAVLREYELAEIVYWTREDCELFLLRSGREQVEADIRNVSCPS